MNWTDWLRVAAELMAVIGGVVAFVRFVRNYHVYSRWPSYAVCALMAGGGLSIFVGDLLNANSVADVFPFNLPVILMDAGLAACILGVFMLIIIIFAG